MQSFYKLDPRGVAIHKSHGSVHLRHTLFMKMFFSLIKNNLFLNTFPSIYYVLNENKSCYYITDRRFDWMFFLNKWNCTIARVENTRTTRKHSCLMFRIFYYYFAHIWGEKTLNSLQFLFKLCFGMRHCTLKNNCGSVQAENRRILIHLCQLCTKPTGSYLKIRIHLIYMYKEYIWVV